MFTKLCQETLFDENIYSNDRSGKVIDFNECHVFYILNILDMMIIFS